jgi:DNA-directed RNA polymerase subunit RPC12/RpoP
MDIVFNCPNCEQELAVDQAGAGSDIECPTCHESITIPASKQNSGPLPSTPTPPPNPPAGAAPAAAKVELHLKVPVRDKPSESLIGKPKPPLEVVQKGAGKRLLTRTIRHASCVESGHDKFDEKLSAFLQEVGESNLIGIHPINYEHFDVGLQKILTDFGVVVVYRG